MEDKWIVFISKTYSVDQLCIAKLERETNKQFRVSNATNYTSIINKASDHVVTTEEKARKALEAGKIWKRTLDYEIRELKETYISDIKEVLENAGI